MRQFDPGILIVADQLSDLVADYETARQEPRHELAWMETIRMRDKARRFGITLPPFDDSDCWEQGKFWEKRGEAFVAGMLLTEDGIAEVERRVREARFVYWKGWAEVLIPILSLLVAIIALLKI